MKSEGKPRHRVEKRNVDGVLLLDKPIGISSNDALQRVKRALQAAKAGHTGNLDVAASGLLPICFGEATKICGFLLAADKTYLACLKLGVCTDTGDAEGQVTQTAPTDGIGRAQVESALAAFIGEISQVPPMYSALKRNGQPLYSLARKGVEVERAARRVSIHELKLLEFAGDIVHVEVRCSKGTYIRTLAEDVGHWLGCGAHVQTLHRTVVGPYAVADASSLESFAVSSVASSNQRFDGLLRPIDSALKMFPAVSLGLDAVRAFRHGQTIAGSIPMVPESSLVRLYAENEQFIGMGIVLSEGRIAPKRVFHHPER